VLATAWDLGRTANLTSTVALTAFSINYVTTAGTVTSANLTQVLGSAPVTTAAGVLATTWDLGRTANLTSTIALSGTTISTNQLVALNAIYGSAPVTTAAGILSAGITGTQTYNITGNLSGSVGSVAGLNAALLDASVSSRLAAAAYTVPPTVAQITSGVLATALSESYRGLGAAPTLAQAVFETIAHLGESSISGTTKTILKVDQLTVAETFTLDSSTAPAAITRAS
jgi:hypothetical protein